MVAELEQALTEKRINAKQLLDGLEIEVARMRKERDSMRLLYEQANNQVSSSNRTNSQLQSTIEKLQIQVQVFEAQQERYQKLNDTVQELVSKSPQEKELSEVLNRFQEDQRALYNELEVLAKAFEDLQNQNILLIKQVAEKEEANGKLLADKLRSEFSLVQAKKDAEISTQKAGILERASLERLEAAEVRERQARSEIIEAEAKLSRKSLENEKNQWRLAELSEESIAARSQLERQLARNNDHVIAEKTRALESIIYEKKRLIEELELAQKKLRSYSGSGHGVQKDLEEELAIYKKLMKCNSCHTREKNAVITKCMHVFCRQCLDTRIETRQRKCPNCGESFGVSDVRSIYL